MNREQKNADLEIKIQKKGENLPEKNLNIRNSISLFEAFEKEFYLWKE